jgi:ubiquinone/menaquinone biosynthesis C-methylase UbiE
MAVQTRWKESRFEGLDRYLGGLVNVPATFKGKAVLEIGAGSGNYVRFIAGHGWPRTIVALDVVPTAGASGFPGAPTTVCIVGGSCLELPFRSACFDVVFGSLVLSVLPNLPRAVAEIWRVLREEGLYVGIEPSLLNPLHWWRYVTGRQFPGDHPVTASQFRMTFRRTGFETCTRPLSPKLPVLARWGVGTCVGIIARKASPAAPAVAG